MIASNVHQDGRRAPAPAGTTVTVSTLHVSPPDLDRIRTQGWPLPHTMGGQQIELCLPATAPDSSALYNFLSELDALGFSKPLTHLVRWACDSNCACLQLDACAEINDRLPLFVG
jgi:hypothetical protein